MPLIFSCGDLDFSRCPQFSQEIPGVEQEEAEIDPRSAPLGEPRVLLQFLAQIVVETWS